jgi:sterol desaturase/sphingolipid hydroxylase (fatty acid hydroxylase superfamily)
MKVAVLFVSGIVLWTLLEYVLHRFVGHASRLGRTGRVIRKQHLLHHATPDYFTTFPRKLVLAVPVLGAIAGAGVLLFGPSGLALMAGTAAGWTFYERLHRATHVHGPRNAYGAWARRHHLHHHFQAPKANHGVTSPLWDWVFGTLERPETIAVPRRHVRCFSWLLAQGGAEVDARYAGTYRLI